eukprot:CAMPEP_0198358572 /NCGR_PEP_ID=MMETSP1450-20131203/131255_1 /TAXON_ID=753684 ORGANISM="Madagascaria erythrocladiodes, Strain CCMP3234" /NCGR_SAMPLE_ID=MMETSP1450 /ASSEMBLY_ACC=CAM_ASM_001115 /LENGTH=61 /DNA_ID=CAMNT_0044065325 /DNA_START=84 /DNA_END=265 /DNA_ORIENTATION=+
MNVEALSVVLSPVLTCQPNSESVNLKDVGAERVIMENIYLHRKFIFQSSLLVPPLPPPPPS